MPCRPVAVAAPLLFRLPHYLKVLLSIAVLAVTILLLSQQAGVEDSNAVFHTPDRLPSPGSVSTKRYFAEIRPEDTHELARILKRAEEISEDNISLVEPIVIILHGPEGAVFENRNYRENKKMVDLAAQLEAKQVVDIKMCQQWLEQNNVSPEELPAFVDTVPYGPDAVKILESRGHVRF